MVSVMLRIDWHGLAPTSITNSLLLLAILALSINYAHCVYAMQDHVLSVHGPSMCHQQHNNITILER